MSVFLGIWSSDFSSLDCFVRQGQWSSFLQLSNIKTQIGKVALASIC